MPLSTRLRHYSVLLLVNTVCIDIFVPCHRSVLQEYVPKLFNLFGWYREENDIEFIDILIHIHRYPYIPSAHMTFKIISYLRFNSITCSIQSILTFGTIFPSNVVTRPNFISYSLPAIPVSTDTRVWVQPTNCYVVSTRSALFRSRIHCQSDSLWHILVQSPQKLLQTHSSNGTLPLITASKTVLAITSGKLGTVSLAFPTAPSITS